MSSRLVAGLLLIFAYAAWKLPVSSTGQELKPSNAPGETKWEYRVHRIDGLQCASEASLSEPLNRLGQDGWELATFERAMLVLPKSADGTLVIKPAATGPGREHTPMTADSFQGTIQMNIADAHAHPGACLMIFKRPGRPASAGPQAPSQK
jgi:hypothetical protein